MPEGIDYSSSNSPAIIGLRASYVGNQVYAYSGIVPVNATETTLLEWTSGNKITIGQFTFNKDTGDGDDMRYQVYINGNVVQGWVHDYSARGFRNIVEIILPPFTNVKATGDNDTSNTDRDTVCTFVGHTV